MYLFILNYNRFVRYETAPKIYIFLTTYTSEINICWDNKASGQLFILCAYKILIQGKFFLVFQ